MSTASTNAPRRKRCDNWSENEKVTLITFLEERIEIIQCKKTDTNTNKKKISAWREIEKKFNKINTTCRNLRQLKEQWKRMKVAARKRIAYYKKIQSAPEGRTNNFKVSEMDWRVHSLMRHECAKHSNKFENDNENHREENIPDDNHFVIPIELDGPYIEEHREENIPDDNHFVIPIELDGPYIEEKPHHQDVNITQDSSRRSRTSSKSSSTRNSESESEYQQLLMERMSEEYGLKIKQMKEIHKLEIKKRRIEIENLLLIREKTQLEIDALKKENKLCEVTLPISTPSASADSPPRSPS